MQKIDTVIFDFDGTVMDTNNVILNSWQHTFRTLENREEKPETIIKTFGEPLELTMKNFSRMFRWKNPSPYTEATITIILES